MKHVFLTISAMGLLLVGAGASACSCVNRTLAEQLDSSEFVALVRVGSVHLNPAFMESRAFYWDNPPLLAEFEVLESYKGEPDGIKHLASGVGGGDCGLPLVPGSDFLVAGTPHGDLIGVMLCSASRPFGFRSILSGASKVRRIGQWEAYIAAVEGHLRREEPIHDCIEQPSAGYAPWDDSAEAQARRAECRAYYETFESED